MIVPTPSLPFARPLAYSENPAYSELAAAHYGVVLAPVDAATEITLGAFCYLETDDVRPASTLFDQGSLSLNQQSFRSVFAGVALQASASGSGGDIAIATRGPFLLTLRSGSVNPGSFVGVCEDGGTTLNDFEVAPVGGVSSALGRVLRDLGDGTVLAELASLFYGGVQASA